MRCRANSPSEDQPHPRDNPGLLVADDKPRFGIDITYASGGLAALWVVLAWFRPESTFHLAPLLVGAMFPLGHRWKSGRLSPAALAGTFVGGLVNVAVPIVILTLGDKLEGPTIGGFSNATVESIVLGVAGVAIGVIAAALPWGDDRERESAM